MNEVPSGGPMFIPRLTLAVAVLSLTAAQLPSQGGKKGAAPGVSPVRLATTIDRAAVRSAHQAISASSTRARQAVVKHFKGGFHQVIWLGKEAPRQIDQGQAATTFIFADTVELGD